MARLHLTYRELAFDDRTIELTKRLLRERPWSKDFGSVTRLYKTWVHGACYIYELPIPQFVIKPTRSGVGEYHPAPTGCNAVIRLHKPSMISMFHQFRHHMQAHGLQEGALGPYASEAEKNEDCQRWATSLMYVVAPRRFRRAVRAGRVAGVHPPDLLKTRRAK